MQGRNREELLDFFRRKLFHAAQRNSFQREGADLVAAEAADGEAERGEEQSDLALLAVVHVDVEFFGGLVGPGVDESGVLDLEALVLDGDAGEQLPEPAHGERVLQRHVVALHDRVGRMHQLVGEVAVGREDDEALAVLVEAAGAEEAELGPLAREEVKDSRGFVRVAVAANEAARLVHHEREFRLRDRAHGLAVDGDFVDAQLDFLAEDGADAVHINSTRGDQRLSGATGADAGVGHEFLNADGFHVKGLNGTRAGAAQRDSRTAPGPPGIRRESGDQNPAD